MTNSRKQLIAQIHQVEQNLYQQREQARQNQTQVSRAIAPILTLILGLGALLLLLKSKSGLKKTTDVIVNAGQIAVLTYFKKQITQFFAQH